VKPEDNKAAIEAGILRKSLHSSGNDGPKRPISQKPRDDLNRVGKGAQQHAALRDPDLPIDLLACHNLRWANPFGIATTEVPNRSSTEGEGYALDERLTINPPRDMFDVEGLVPRLP